jgi:hypothetical protein
MAYLFVGISLLPIVMLAALAWRTWCRERLDPANPCDRASVRERCWH